LKLRSVRKCAVVVVRNQSEISSADIIIDGISSMNSVVTIVIFQRSNRFTFKRRALMNRNSVLDRDNLR